MKKILISLSVIGLVGTMAIGATMAYYGDTETSEGNTMTAGSIDLKIDYKCEDDLCEVPFKNLGVGDHFFGRSPLYCDIKPGDSGEVTISWHVTNNKAWGRMTIADIQDFEYGCTEPEAEYPDPTCGPDDPFDPGAGLGELSQHMTFTAWMDEGNVEGWQCYTIQGGCPADLEEGDNIFNGSYEVKIAEDMLVSEFATNGIQLPEILEPGTVYFVGLQWNLPFETPNIVQTDSLVASIVMEVVQSRNNPNPWPSTVTQLNNGGFEMGDFTGWNMTIPSGASANVVSSHTGDQGMSYAPTEGSYFALLKTDGPGSLTKATQQFTVSAGQTIQGWAAFDSGDYQGFNDNAAVKIFDSSNSLIVTPWFAQVNGNPDYWDGPWTSWSWTASVDGTYTVELSIVNEGDSGYDSYTLFDANVIMP